MIGGIDEAGRGPVIGPMIIVGAWIDDQEKLLDIGVKDSKLLTRDEREEIFSKLIKILPGFRIEVVLPREIDKFIEIGIGLNNLELMKFAKIAKEIPASEIIVDCPDVKEDRFKRRLESIVGKRIIAKHNADKEFPIVGAASIIAKVTRDRFIDLLKEEVGDFGSGYPSDPKTKRFLRENFDKIKNWKYVRKTWETFSSIEKSLKQRSLFDFL